MNDLGKIFNEVDLHIREMQSETVQEYLNEFLESHPFPSMREIGKKFGISKQGFMSQIHSHKKRVKRVLKGGEYKKYALDDAKVHAAFIEFDDTLSNQWYMSIPDANNLCGSHTRLLMYFFDYVYLDIGGGVDVYHSKNVKSVYNGILVNAYKDLIRYFNKNLDYESIKSLSKNLKVNGKDLLFILENGYEFETQDDLWRLKTKYLKNRVNVVVRVLSNAKEPTYYKDIIDIADKEYGVELTYSAITNNKKLFKSYGRSGKWSLRK